MLRIKYGAFVKLLSFVESFFSRKHKRSKPLLNILESCLFRKLLLKAKLYKISTSNMLRGSFAKMNFRLGPYLRGLSLALSPIVNIKNNVIFPTKLS